GLGAHPYYTWVKKGSTTNNLKPKSFRDRISRRNEKSQSKGSQNGLQEIMWPRDLLVPAFKNARVATYSYKSDWKDATAKTSLRQCAEQLLNVLVQHRQDANARQRPLVLIGHSLGGLLIQQALVIAVHQKVFDDLRLSVAGIVFLGTPFQGSDAAIYGKWLAQLGSLDTTLIKSLEKDSPALHALSSDFWHSYNDRDIVCFYENKDAEYGPWKTRVVTAQSASLLGKRMIFLDTDHSGLNKFGIDDENFALVLPEIQRMVKEGASVVRNRLRKDAGRPETPPDPSSTIPFRRDPDFVDRETMLDQLNQKCAEPGSRAALVGLGGVGKSQLAIEYGYRTRERSSKVWVFWVYAGSTARFEQSYREIADNVEISGREDPKANIFKLVHDWLRKEKHGRWLLILDNVDNALFPSKGEKVGQGAHKTKVDDKDSQLLLKYLPESQNGRALITTRSREVALKLVEEGEIIT
ncbi:MAG: hypothetical protein Q9214_006785, partial [Letrouitia sp. 1 TL-2023]